MTADTGNPPDSSRLRRIQRLLSRHRGIAAVAAVFALIVAGGTVVLVRATTTVPTVTVLADWTGGEEALFKKTVVAPFERTHRIRIDYQGSSAETQVLAAAFAAGSPPDVIVLPGRGELAGYADDQLKPLDGQIDPDDYLSSWLLRQHRRIYAVPVKADLKSTVWYPASTTPARAEQEARDPAQWCIGMGAKSASGWPGTDWIEDILLQRHGPAVYRQFADGTLSWTDPRVKAAWQEFGRMVGAGTPAAQRALLTPYGTAPHGLEHRCGLVYQASYVLADPVWRAHPAAHLPSARILPGARRDSRDVEVSGDFAALTSTRKEAAAFLRYLASPQVQRAWPGADHGFSVNRQAQHGARYRGGAAGSYAGQVFGDPHYTKCQDASDAMAPALRDAFTQAVVRYLARPTDLDGILAGLRRTARGEPSAAGSAPVCTTPPGSG